MKSLVWSHAFTIAIVELRRRARKLRENVWQVLALCVLGVFMVPIVGAAIFGFFAFGSSLQRGAIENPIELVRMGIVGVWTGVAIFGGYRAYAFSLAPDRLEGMLTTVSHRELAAGMFLAEFLLWGTFATVFLVPVSAAFAFGAGSPAAPLTLVTTGAIVLLTALVVGFVGALAIRNMGTRSVLLTRLRTVAIVLLAIGYMAFFLTQAFVTVLDPLVTLLAPTPIGWLADFAVAGTLPEASALRAIAALVGNLLVVGAGGWAMLTLAGMLWYADGVHLDQRHAHRSSRPSRLEAILPRPIAGVVLTDLLRARRAPITLSFVLYPLFFMVWPIMDVIETGEIAPSFALWVLLAGAWITGALFTLNVLGSEGAVLPITLITEGPARSLVGGHTVASAMIGVPVTIVATIGFAVLGGHAPETILTLGVSALGLALGAPMVASGVGAVFPRFEEVSVTRSTTAVIPSTLAFGIYSIVILVSAAPTLIAHSFVSHWLGEYLGWDVLSVLLGGTLVSVGLALAFGTVGAWYAVRRVRKFVLDR